MRSMRNIWLLYLLSGITAIIFGIVFIIIPEASMALLAGLFSALAIVIGLIAIVRSIRLFRIDRTWWIVLLEGLFAIGIGLLVLFYPVITAIALLYIIGAWAIVTGIWEISYGMRYRKLIENEYIIIIIGILSIVFGGILFFRPFVGAMGLMALMSFFFILRGITSIAFSVRLKKIED